MDLSPAVSFLYVDILFYTNVWYETSIINMTKVYKIRMSHRWLPTQKVQHSRVLYQYFADKFSWSQDYNESLNLRTIVRTEIQ